MKNKKGKKNKKGDWLFHLEIVAATLLLILFVGALFSQVGAPSNASEILPITGFVSVDTKIQDVNIEVSESQLLDLQVDESFKLTSFRTTGKVYGDGIVIITLEQPGQEEYLVYTNIVQEKQKNLITGLAYGINVISGKKLKNMQLDEKNDILLSEKPDFYMECIRSCFVDLEIDPENPPVMKVQLSEGTKVNIDQIVYTILTE